MSLFTPPDAERASISSRRRRTVWVSFGLVYLAIWPMSGLFGPGHPASEAIIGVVTLAVFVGLFIGLVISNNPWSATTTRSTWVLLGLLTAMTVCCPILLGSGWSGLPIYLGVAYAMALPPAWSGRGVMGATALSPGVLLLAHATVGTATLLTFETLTIGMLMLGFRSSRILVTQLHEARGEVARLAANEERLRISRDLHDLLGHTLALIVLKSEVAARLADRDPAKSLGEVKDIETVARQALSDVREAVSGYRQRRLTDELDNARGVLGAAGIDLTITSSGTPLPDPLDGLFGWAVREGVTNIVRHSRARTATIGIARQDAMAVLEITDNGLGPQPGSSGNGLTGLDERVAHSGGSVTSGPGPRGGFRLTVRVPLTPPAPETADAEDRSNVPDRP